MKLTNKEKHYFIFKRRYLCIPYAIFLLLFIVAPIIIIAVYAFLDEDGGFSFNALINFFSDRDKINVLFVSLFFATQTTLICLIIGFPLAYFLADKKVNKNAVLVTLFLAPMWINFVMRTWATRDLLYLLHLDGGTHPYLATTIGMVQNYLPFVILPLYTTMLKLDKSQIEAASDLGANPAQVFVKNILPQSVPGIVSAATMTFMPTMSSYVISDVLSEYKITLFGNYIYLDFSNSMWADGSFMALVMLFLVGISMFISSRFDKKKQTVGGGLW